jgi:hypothetical protein
MSKYPCAMRYARPAHTSPRHLPVLVRKFSVSIHHFGGGLANDDEAHNDRLLGASIGKKVFLAQAFDKTTRVGRRQPHVIEVIGQTVLDHIGCASTNTR